MPYIEFVGKTTEEAIKSACDKLGLPSDEFKFEIISTGSSGIFGLLASKKARIKVMVDDKDSDRPKLSAGDDEEEVNFTRAPNPSTSKLSLENTQGNHKKPPLRESRPKKSKPPEKKKSAEAAAPSKAAEASEPAPAAPTEAVVYDGPEDEAMTRGKEALEGILNLMPVEASVQVGRVDDRIVLNISGDNSGLLIGKKGATLDALQYIVSKVVNKSKNDRHHVVVDTGEYRSRRYDSLVSLGLKMANKVRRTNKPASINGLSAHDRRIIHMTLKGESGLVTRSKGDGAFKKIVIFPSQGKKGGKRDNQKRRDTRSAVPETPAPVESTETEAVVTAEAAAEE